MNNETILDILTQTTEYVSGQALAQRLGVSRQAVWKGVNALRQQGFDIQSVTNRGYRLTSFPEHLNALAVKAALHTHILGAELTVLDSVGSTNDVLKMRGSEGCKSGAVVCAREQVSGKGRMGRTWQSKRDENLYFSFLLRPKMAPAEASSVTLLTGLAICRALQEVSSLDCRIKWPNDVIVGSKKVCGILTEMSTEFDAVEFIVTGVGVNVAQTAFPDDIAQKATSLLTETGTCYNKNLLLARLLERMEEAFIQYQLELTPQALEDYSRLCATLGRSIGFTRGGTPLCGTAERIDKSGALVVRLPDGALCAVNSGEVTAQGIY